VVDVGLVAVLVGVVVVVDFAGDVTEGVVVDVVDDVRLVLGVVVLDQVADGAEVVR